MLEDDVHVAAAADRPAGRGLDRRERHLRAGLARPERGLRPGRGGPPRSSAGRSSSARSRDPGRPRRGPATCSSDERLEPDDPALEGDRLDAAGDGGHAPDGTGRFAGRRVRSRPVDSGRSPSTPNGATVTSFSDTRRRVPRGGLRPRSAVRDGDRQPRPRRPVAGPVGGRPGRAAALRRPTGRRPSPRSATTSSRSRSGSIATSSSASSRSSGSATRSSARTPGARSGGCTCVGGGLFDLLAREFAPLAVRLGVDRRPGRAACPPSSTRRARRSSACRTGRSTGSTRRRRSSSGRA